MENRFSYSRLTTYEQCPKRFWYRYIKGVEVEQLPPSANDPLILGKAMHLCLQEGLDTGISWYYNQFNIATNEIVNEEIKLRYMAKRVLDICEGFDGCEIEKHIKGDRFHGFADFIDHESKIVYDIKYCSGKSFDKYDGKQLCLYNKYLGEGYKLVYILIEKTYIRQKKTETIEEFRKRLTNDLENRKVELREVEYKDPTEWFNSTIQTIENDNEFVCCPTRLCSWCEYEKYCKGVEMLPKNEKRKIEKNNNIKLWIYGEPFSGKTTFASKFPDPIFLNTDGNIKYIDSPYIAIKDCYEGRIEKSGWEVFKGAIKDLMKDEEFKTVVVDLTEGVYELCRSYVCNKNGWKHESDDSFRAWDIVRKEFLDEMKRLTNLDKNIVLISHLDATRDITARGGDKVTDISPNIQPKIAKILAGMVDVVGKVYVQGEEHYIDCTKRRNEFGGGRIQLKEPKVSLDYEEFSKQL